MAQAPRRLVPPNPPLTDGVVMLRPWSDQDADQVYEACQDPALQAFIPVPRPYARDDATSYIARTRREWAEGTKAAFAIVDATDPSRLLGSINVAISGGVGNSGYWVAPAERGHGVAGRALRLLADWAFSEIGLGVILLEIRPQNEASRRVARSAGFREAGTLGVHFPTGKQGALLYSRLASDPVPEVTP